MNTLDEPPTRFPHTGYPVARNTELPAGWVGSTTVPTDALLRPRPESTGVSAALTVADVLDQLGDLQVQGNWSEARRDSLHTVVVLLCGAVPGSSMIAPNPVDTVALHLRALRYLALNNAVLFGLEPSDAARALVLVDSLVSPA
ncbi:MAG: hypothetical protein ACK5O2_02035 [Microthrixaceae bacterium]